MLNYIFTESLAEYLSLKLTKELLSEKSYFRNINGKIHSLNNLKLTGFKNIEKNSDYGDRELYIYTYAPIIWLAIEKEIGEKKMWLWLNKMLTVETEKTNYKFMIETLASVLNDDNMLTFLVKKYFANLNAINNAKILLKETINNT